MIAEIIIRDATGNVIHREFVGLTDGAHKLSLIPPAVHDGQILDGYTFSPDVAPEGYSALCTDPSVVLTPRKQP